MDKERILNKIMGLLREQPTVNTASTPSAAGFSSKAPAKGPTAGLDKKVGKKKKKYIYQRNTRKNWM